LASHQAISSSRAKPLSAQQNPHLGPAAANLAETLTLDVKARITPSEMSNEKAPDFRIFADQIVECGAAWKKISSDGREYLSIRLDDPQFFRTDLRLAGRGRKGFLADLVPPQ
jgi:uncharacterized protein (DUF736 family)